MDNIESLLNQVSNDKIYSVNELLNELQKVFDLNNFYSESYMISLIPVKEEYDYNICTVMIYDQLSNCRRYLDKKFKIKK